MAAEVGVKAKPRKPLTRDRVLRAAIALADHGLLDVPELQHVGRAVSVLNDRLHGVSPFGLSADGHLVGLVYAVHLAGVA